MIRADEEDRQESASSGIGMSANGRGSNDSRQQLEGC